MKIDRRATIELNENEIKQCIINYIEQKVLDASVVLNVDIESSSEDVDGKITNCTTAKANCKMKVYREFEKYKEGDLRNLLVDGRVVEFANGSTGFVINNRILLKDSWTSIFNLDDELKNKCFDDSSINFVFEDKCTPNSSYHFGWNVDEAVEEGLLKVIWRRED